MIPEIAELTINPGHEAEFEDGVAKAAPLFLRAKGCHGVVLEWVVKTPGIYRLVVGWETVEDHAVGFRYSADFQTWEQRLLPRPTDRATSRWNRQGHCS